MGAWFGGAVVDVFCGGFVAADVDLLVAGLTDEVDGSGCSSSSSSPRNADRA